MYGVRNFGQQEYGDAEACTYCVNPSEHKPNLICRGLAAKSGYTLSKCFQAFPSLGCRNKPSSRLFSWCRLICLAESIEAYNLCNLGMIVK